MKCLEVEVQAAKALFDEELGQRAQQFLKGCQFDGFQKVVLKVEGGVDGAGARAAGHAEPQPCAFAREEACDAASEAAAGGGAERFYIGGSDGALSEEAPEDIAEQRAEGPAAGAVPLPKKYGAVPIAAPPGHWGRRPPPQEWRGAWPPPTAPGHEGGYREREQRLPTQDGVAMPTQQAIKTEKKLEEVRNALAVLKAGERRAAVPEKEIRLESVPLDTAHQLEVKKKRQDSKEPRESVSYEPNERKKTRTRSESETLATDSELAATRRRQDSRSTLKEPQHEPTRPTSPRGARKI